MLEPSLRTYTGVDLSSIFPEENNGSLKGCWKRMMIFFIMTYYLVTKDMMIDVDNVKGSRFYKEITFQMEESGVESVRYQKLRPK